MVNSQIYDIKFEQKIKKNMAENGFYFDKETLLLHKGEVFDPEENYDNSKIIRDCLFEKYLCFFKTLCPEGHVIVVKLSGIHVNAIDLLKQYTFGEESRNHAIFHYHHWKVDSSDAIDEDAFIILKCDDNLFDDLFDKYWFSFDAEYHFEGVIIKDQDTVFLEKWSRFDEDDMKRGFIIDKSFLVFDNLQNGFHFKITTNKMPLDRGIEDVFDF